MVVTITVSVEGDSLAEARAALETVFSQQPAPELPYPTQTAEPPVLAPAINELQSNAPLSSDELRELWQAIKPDARRLWAEIAKRPSGYPFDDLKGLFKLEGSQVSGRTSSIGAQLRNRFPSRPHPLQRNWATRRFEMNPEQATIIRKLAEEMP